MRHTILAFILLLVATLPVSAQESVTGLKKWAKNGFCGVRVTEIKEVKTQAEFEALNWSKRLTEQEATKLFKHTAKKVFSKDKKVVLLKVDFKNLGDKKMKAGYFTPHWILRGDDGQEVKNKRGFPAKTTFMITGGFPKKTELNPKQTVSGWMAFFLPTYDSPKLLFFKSPSKKARKTFGESQSLVIKF